MSIDFCARRISAAIGEIVRTEGLPSVLQDALVELRLPNVVALKELVAEVLRCPERVCDTLIAIAVTIERHKYLRAAVLKRIKMTASDRAAFKALFKPVLFVSIRLDTAREPHFFWMDEPRSPASMPSNWQASFPTDLIHSIPLMGRAFLDSLVQGDPDRVYVAIDMTPDRAAYWTELLKQRIAGGLTRHSLNEMKPYMNGVRVSKEQIQALKEASEKGQEKAYVFEMPYYHIVIRWCIPCDIVQDTRLPDITQIDTLVIQGELLLAVLIIMVTSH